MQGAYSSTNFKYLNFSIVRCSPDLGHQNCKSSQEIDKKLAGGRFVVAILNSYVDFEDYENVIKTYIDERFIFRVDPGVYKESILYLRNNHVKLADELIQLGTTRDLQFYNIETSNNDFYTIDTDIYLSVYMRMEAREDTYERTVFSLFDLTGLVGGVFEILEVTGGIFVSFFAHKLFMFSMLNDLYQVQKTSSNYEFSKIIPSTREITAQRKRNKCRPRMYEETKMPKKNSKMKNKSNFNIKSSNVYEIFQSKSK